MGGVGNQFRDREKAPADVRQHLHQTIRSGFNRDGHVRTTLNHSESPGSVQYCPINYSGDCVLVTQAKHLRLQQFTLADTNAPILVDSQLNKITHDATPRSNEATP